MITLQDLYILKIAIEERFLTPEKIRPHLQVFPKDMPLEEYLYGNKLLSKEGWKKCSDMAREKEGWPEGAEKIQEDNREVYNLLYESGRIDVDFLNSMFSEIRENYSKSKYSHLCAHLIQSGIMTENMVFKILKVQKEIDMLCPHCKYALEVDQYFPWQRYPCILCAQNLVPMTATSDTVKYPSLPEAEKIIRERGGASGGSDKGLQKEEEPSEEEETKGAENSWGKKWRHFSNYLAYKYDNYLSQGAIYQFISLFTIFLIALFACTLIFVGTLETKGFSKQIWQTFLFLFDAGSVGEAGEFTLVGKLLAIGTGVIGIIIFSILIAFLTNLFDQQLQELQKGKSLVVEKGHSLILGWSDKVVSILKELILANENESSSKVVILSTRDKVELEDYLITAVKDRKTTKIIVRSGQISRIANQEKVSLDCAKSIILVSACARHATKKEKGLSDTMIIKTILSITKNPNRRAEPYHIVTEIFDGKNIELARSIGGDEIEVLKTNEILGKVLAQTSRQNGLASIYNELFSFDGAEIYVVEIPELYGKTFGQSLFYFPTCVPIGLKKKGQRAKVNPPMETPVEEGDQIVVVAEDDSTIYYEDMKVEEKEYTLPSGREKLAKRAEKYLIFGWNDKCENIVREYDDYLAKGSKIDIVIPNPTEEILALEEEMKKTLQNIALTIIQKDYRDREELMALNPFSYENVSILATELDGEVDIEEIDSQTIYTLLLLRDMQKKNPSLSRDTRLITEVLDSENRELLQIAQVNDVVISDHLISMMLAQISEQKRMVEVYEDLLSAEGSEIYLKPASLYFETFPVKCDFIEMMMRARARGEATFAYRIRKLENSPEENYGICMNPDKRKMVTLEARDQLVVVSEDDD